MTCWADAVAAAQLFAVDPAGLGVAVRAPAGPLRDAWLAVLRDALPAGLMLRRVPLAIADDRLLGGVDLAATLSAGRPVHARGLLAEAEGGVLLLAMAERVSPGVAARLGAACDGGARFGIVALDEGIEDERPPSALMDRLAFSIVLDELSPIDPGQPQGEGESAARALLPNVETTDAIVEALCTTAAALGIASLRAPILALRAARAAAAHAGRREVTAEDAALAARLVLAPRATQLPDSAPPEAEPDQSSDPEPDPTQSDKPLEDQVLDAAKAAIPAGLLAQLQTQARPRQDGGQIRCGEPVRASVAAPPACGRATRGVACAST